MTDWTMGTAQRELSRLTRRRRRGYTQEERKRIRDLRNMLRWLHLNPDQKVVTEWD